MGSGTDFKRVTVCAVVGIILLAGMAGTATAQSVMINGVPLVTTRTPVNVAGSILLPMRDVFEALNSEVKWFAPEQKVMAIRGQTTIELWLGRRTATINGQPVDLPVAPTMIGGSTYVPLRFPAEAFGGTVEWQAAARTAVINIPEPGEAPGPPTPPEPPAPVPPDEPPAPPAPVTVDGVVLQVLTAPASVLVQVDQTGLPQAIPVGANTQITRSVAGEAAQSAQLSEARPGDYAQAVLGDQGVAASLALSYGQAEGTAIALAGSTLVLQDGTAFRVSDNVRVVDAGGQPAALNAVKQNTPVQIVFEPNSRVVWEIRLQSTEPPAPEPPAQEPQILTVGILNQRTLFKGGDMLNLQLRGTPGGQATMNVGRVGRDIALQEVEPGVYQAEFTIPANANVRNIAINGNLVVGGVRAQTAVSPTRISIDSTPPLMTNMRPAAGSTVENTSPVIELTFDSRGGEALDPQSVRLWVDRREVTRDAAVTPEKVTYVAENLQAGPTAVEAVVADAAGNEARVNWSFTVGTAANNIITAASHDAPGVLVGGNVLTVTAQVVRPGGTATFDIGTLRRNQPMQRVGNTSTYRGTYTVRTGDRVTEAAVRVRYRDPQGQTATLEATTPVNIDTNLPTTVRITRPTDQSQAGEVITVAGEAPPYSRVRLTVTYRARIITWITGQLWQDVLQATAQGTWETPEIGMNVGLFGRADEYVILAELLNADNQVVAEHRISLKK